MAMSLVGIPNADQSASGPDHLVPPAARFFASMLMGERAPISQKDFSASELALLNAAVKRAEAEGRDYIGYGDYGENDPWSTGNGQAFGALTDRPTSLANTLGMAKFKRMPDGTVVITDSYDFNASRAVATKRMQQAGGLPGAIVEGLTKNGLVGVGNVLGNAVLPEGEGRPVKITLKPTQKTTPDAQQGGRTKMADNFADFYTGSMAPPLRMPGGGYAPAPSYTAPTSIEDIYRGIYSPSGAPALSTVSRPTVPINPQTGMPYMTTASARGGAGVGHGYAASGSATYAAPRAPSLANPVRDLGVPQYGVPGSGGGVLTKSGLPPNATTEKRFTEQLVPRAPGAVGGSASSGIARFGSGTLTASLPSLPDIPSAPVHQLNIDPPADEGQMYADSMGLPVRSKSGTVYTPKVPGSAVMPSGKVAPRYGGPKVAPAASERRGGLFGLGGGGGLLNMLFGGSGGGLFGRAAAPAGVGLIPGVGAAQAASGPGPTYTTTPFQEDRFQTTTGAQMPSSMNNERWTTGY